MQIEFIGLTMKENAKYPMFEYKITIGKHSTTFLTGIGWVTPKREEGTSIYLVPDQFKHFFAKVSIRSIGLSKWDVDQVGVVYRKNPKPSDIAESLLSDIDAGSYSFNDFCDNYGYSNDSLKALDTYRACMDMSSKFKKADLLQYLTEQQKEDLGLN